MDDPEVQHILDIITSTPFTRIEHKLLSSFVTDSVLPEVTAAYLLERISLESESKQSVEFALQRVLTDWKALVEKFRQPAPLPVRCSQSVLKRDGSLCCLTDRSSLWWDILGWSRIVTASIVPNDLLLIYGNATSAPLQELLTQFIGKEQVQRLQSILSVESKGPCRNHWTLRRDAATAFREGSLYLTPRWDIQRRPEEDLKPKCKYTLWTTMPTPSLPTTSKEQTLRSGSQIEMFTSDPVSAPLPSAFLFGIHARFCNSLRALHIDRDMSSRRPYLVLQWAKEIRSACLARAFPLFRRLWSYFPRQARIFVYRMLLNAGTRIYGKSNLWTQRVPFGLYIKHGRGELIPKGEGPALQLVEHYTNIPSPKLIEALVDGGYTYLVMTRVTGQPLIQAIYTMGYPERKALAIELSKYVGQLASIPNRNKAAICDANGGPVFDYRLEGRLAGPFESEADFNNFIITQARLRVPSHDRPHKICFTHADLNPKNILVDSGRLSGIVDFGCAGYYPEYWEYTKAIFSTPGLDSSFVDLFEDTFGDCYRDELEAERDLWLVKNPF